MIITKSSPYTKEEIDFRNKQKLAIESLSMDLLRAALGYHRGSIKMAKRFSEEAIRRKNEIDTSKVKPYLAKILKQIPKVFNSSDTNKVAEDSLTYSIICKNYVKKFF